MSLSSPAHRAPLTSGLNYSPLVLTPAHRPPPPRIAELIGDNKICKEIRTYLAWMDDAHVRYGKEVVYFAVLNAGNYNYIMEWTFRDDGTILARAGCSKPYGFCIYWSRTHAQLHLATRC